MKKNFNEIDSFFLKKSFTKEELDELIKLVDKKYSDNDKILEIAKILIDFELTRRRRRDNALRSVKEEIKKKAPIQKSRHSEFSIKIEALASELKWSVEHILFILSQRNIHKNKLDTLTRQEYLTIKPMINARRKKVNQIVQAKSRKKATSKSNKKPSSKNIRSSTRSSNDVWDKLALYGPGKLIYIRSR